MIEPILTAYSEARHKIRDADLLLFRRRNWYTRVIAVAGRSQYVHAAMAGRWKDRLMCVEMTSGGGRAQLLSNLVATWPGVIDVYDANALRQRFSREKALAAMIGITGKRYGWVNLFCAACCTCRCSDSWSRPIRTTTRPRRWPPFCSQAVAMPTPGRSRSRAEPGRPVDRAGRFIPQPILQLPFHPDAVEGGIGD